jgi:hypothetical protein
MTLGGKPGQPHLRNWHGLVHHQPMLQLLLWLRPHQAQANNQSVPYLQLHGQHQSMPRPPTSLMIWCKNDANLDLIGVLGIVASVSSPAAAVVDASPHQVLNNSAKTVQLMPKTQQQWMT